MCQYFPPRLCLVDALLQPLCPLESCLSCPLARSCHHVHQDWLPPRYSPYPLPDLCSRPSIFILVASIVDIIVATVFLFYTVLATGKTAVWTSVYCGRSGSCVSSCRRMYSASFGFSTLNYSMIWETMLFALWNPSLSTVAFVWRSS